MALSSPRFLQDPQKPAVMPALQNTLSLDNLKDFVLLKTLKMSVFMKSYKAKPSVAAKPGY